MNCPHCQSTLLWSEDRGAHCDGCDDFQDSSLAASPGCGAAPHRVHLERKRGFRLPENTVVVSRPSKWGNPHSIGQSGSRAKAVQLYRGYIAGMLFIKSRDLAELRGKNLACWCPKDQPCHADVLLELANDEHHNNQAVRTEETK